jgi:hypothetical protein
MPNHCFNRVHLTGTPDDIAAVTALLLTTTEDGAETVTMHTLIPEPPDLATTPSDGILPAWYDWRIAHWGTKWDFYDVEITDRDAETLGFVCSTAWAPPEPFVEALRTRFPNLSVSWFYDEPGHQLAGYL